jgi:hypothetical protein
MSRLLPLRLSRFVESYRRHDAYQCFLIISTAAWTRPSSRSSTCSSARLRKKLANASSGKNYIETVWGRGYVLREPHEDEARIA